MSAGSTPPPNVVGNCGCKHMPAPQGSNEICPYSPGVTCGGPTYCPICRANNPIGTQPPAMTPNIPPPSPPNVAGEWHGIPIEADEADSGRKPESGE